MVDIGLLGGEEAGVKELFGAGGGHWGKQQGVLDVQGRNGSRGPHLALGLEDGDGEQVLDRKDEQAWTKNPKLWVCGSLI